MAKEFGSFSSSLVPFNTSIQNSALNPEAPEYYPIQPTSATTTYNNNKNNSWVSTTTVSSGYYHFQAAAAGCSSAVVMMGPLYRPLSTPPLSLYFPGQAPGPISPRLPLHPFNFLVAQSPLPSPSPSEMIRYETQMMTQGLGHQAVADQNHDQLRAIATATTSGATVEARRCFGRRRGGCYQWRVKSSRGRGADHRGHHRVKNLYEAGERSKVAVMRPGAGDENENGEDEEDRWRMVSYRSCKMKGMKYAVKPVEKGSKDTTLMIRNIPSRYNRDLMLEFLDSHCMQVNQKLGQSSDQEADGSNGSPSSAYDFFYMPMDFRTELNKSYAFVNFSTPEAVRRFYTNCHNSKWDHFQSNKIREIVVAKFQGMDELLDHFGKTLFTCDFDEYLPVCFEPPRDGSADSPCITTIVGKRVQKPN